MSATGSPGAFRIWLMALRPKTLPAGAVPVLIGGALAYGGDAFHWPALFAALAAALLIQIGANLCNDLYDYLKQADGADRIGPVRVTQAGLVSPGQMRRAIALVFALALILGVFLVLKGGVPILLIGLVSLLFAALYTAGPYPLAYLGLGDLFVLVFFGPVAVGGTYYLITGEIDALVLAAGVAPGMISTAILTVNNLRDIDGDRAAGKRTLAVRFGRAFTRGEYLFMLTGAAVSGPLIALATGERPWLWLTLLTMVPAIPAIRQVLTSESGPVLNRCLAATGRLLVIFGALFIAGWLL